MFFCVFFSNAENYGEGAKIKLDSNLLPYLDAAVFQSIVTGFKENRYATAFISVANSKKTIKNKFSINLQLERLINYFHQLQTPSTVELRLVVEGMVGLSRTQLYRH